MMRFQLFSWRVIARGDIIGVRGEDASHSIRSRILKPLAKSEVIFGVKGNDLLRCMMRFQLFSWRVIARGEIIGVRGEDASHSIRSRFFVAIGEIGGYFEVKGKRFVAMYDEV